MPEQILNQMAMPVAKAPTVKVSENDVARPHLQSRIWPLRHSRKYDVLSLTLLLGLLLLLLWGPLTAGRLIIGHDMDQPYNWEAFNRQAFARGELPLWNPYNFSGFPAQADIQTVVFYPPHWLLRPLPLTLESFFMWSLTAHLWLLGAGGYALARQIGASRPASLATAIGLMLGGVSAPRVFAGQVLLINGFAWLPLALTLAIRSLTSRSYLPSPPLVLVLVTQFLAGAAQPSIYTLAAIGALAGYATLRPIEPPASIGARFRPLVAFSTLVALFVLLSAFQILPMLAMMQEAARSGGLPYSRTSKGAFVPEHLLTLFLPDLFSSYATDFQDGFSGGIWEKSPYVGFLLAAAAPFALLNDRRRWFAIFFALLALLTLAFAMAEHLPFFWLHHLILRGIRGPGRLMALWCVSIAVLGALGLDELFTRVSMDWRRRALLAVTGLVLLGSAVILAWQGTPELAGRSWQEWRITRAEGPSLLLALVLVLGFLVFRRTTKVPAVVVATALVAVDLTLFAGQFFTISGPGRNEEIANVLATEGGVQRVLSVCTGELSSPAMMSLALPSPDGYNSSYLRDYGDFASMVRGEPVGVPGPTFPKFGEPRILKQIEYLRFMSASHILTCDDPGEPFQRMYASEKWQLYRSPDPLPRALWVCAVMSARSNAEAARMMSEQNVDLSRQAVVDSKPAAVLPPIGPRCADEARLDVVAIDRPDGYTAVEVDAPDDGLLVLNDASYPERQARVDGQPAEALRVDLAFTAIPVTEGRHRVELQLVPRSLFIGSVVSGVALLGWAAVIMFVSRRRLKPLPGAR